MARPLSDPPRVWVSPVYSFRAQSPPTVLGSLFTSLAERFRTWEQLRYLLARSVASAVGSAFSGDELPARKRMLLLLPSMPSQLAAQCAYPCYRLDS